MHWKQEEYISLFKEKGKKEEEEEEDIVIQFVLQLPFFSRAPIITKNEKNIYGGVVFRGKKN